MIKHWEINEDFETGTVEVKLDTRDEKPGGEWDEVLLFEGADKEDLERLLHTVSSLQPTEEPA